MLHFVLHTRFTHTTLNSLHLNDLRRFSRSLYLYISFYRPYTYKKGYPVYDTRVMSAVRRFQKDAGLTQNGKISGSLLSSLQSWDKKNTTLLLGIRTLAYNVDSPVSGADVAELIELLNKAGFPPNQKKLKYSGGKAVFTKDIETAVRLFQAYNGLTVNGNVDETTLDKLKAK